jgi:hypothetical protein
MPSATALALGRRHALSNCSATRTEAGFDGAVKDTARSYQASTIEPRFTPPALPHFHIPDIFKVLRFPQVSCYRLSRYPRRGAAFLSIVRQPARRQSAVAFPHDTAAATPIRLQPPLIARRRRRCPDTPSSRFSSSRRYSRREAPIQAKILSSHYQHDSFDAIRFLSQVTPSERRYLIYYAIRR